MTDRDEKCSDCGLERREHSYNGGAYGLCGEFVAPTPEVTITISRRSDGGLRVRSSDAAGLHLAGPNPQEVITSIWPALLALEAEPKVPK